jgi:hypothetical protein
VIQRRADFSLKVEQPSPLAYALLSVFGDDGARVDEACRRCPKHMTWQRTHCVLPACPFWASCTAGCWLLPLSEVAGQRPALPVH